MDRSLKPCISTASWDVDQDNLVLVDRLTSLPDELLIHILSLLPTKDVAATCILNRRLMFVFPFITTLDFDAEPIYRPYYTLQRYSFFVAFVNTVLQAHQSKYLTKFRLHAGVSCSFITRLHKPCPPGCSKHCLPDLKSTESVAWISFPLNLCGLRELDLSILVREPGDAQLPPAIFTCQSLEVLKLEVNLGFDHVFSTPSYHLPNLRFLSLRVPFLSDDGFLTRLLACCPLLEDLTYIFYIHRNVSHVTIQSSSIRRLSLEFNVLNLSVQDNPDTVRIHTPSLEYLCYNGNVAVFYSIPTMPSLVTAELDFADIVNWEEDEVTVQQIINLITTVSNVQHLYLSGIIFREFHYYADRIDLKDQLPMLPNLNYLTLGYSSGVYHWCTFLLHLLNSSPVLELLVIEEGVLDGYGNEYVLFGTEYDKLEREFLGTVHPIPSCCRYHLKKIEINCYMGIPRELEIVQFFLRHALVLEELIIYLNKKPTRGYPIPNQTSVENSLENLPKASVTCSIQVLSPP